MRRNYWSCSKFADWLRGTPKLLGGTTKEWNAWEKAAKTKKIRYWLAEEGLDFLQDFICWPSDLLRNVRHYFDNRWISKTHALTSNLKRGQWHEFDTRLLHALFNELVNFVEVEQAWLHTSYSEKKYKNRNPLKPWRCPEAGFAYLEWAAALKKDEDWVDKNDPGFGQPTPQALAAQETIALYKWWKEERPKRPDPAKASGWEDNCKEKRRAAVEGDLSWICDPDELGEERSRKILETLRKMEQEQEDEDTEMLIRLIKIRGSLWT